MGSSNKNNANTSPKVSYNNYTQLNIFLSYYYKSCRRLISNLKSFRHSWLRRRLPKPPSEAPPANRPSAVLRHHHLLAVQQQNTSNGDASVAGGRTTSGIGGNNGIHTAHNHHQQIYNNTNSKTFSSTNELNRHQKLPHIGGVQLNSILD
jgi:hypothetical protein